VECWDYYCYYPWPVEVTVQSSNSSIWTWLGPFGGSVLLFVASMITLWLTVKSTDKRAEHDRDAATQRANDDRDAARQRDEFDRRAARADQLRIEVAAILAERPATLDSQRALFDATFQHRIEVNSDSVSPAERSAKVLDIRQLHIEHSDMLEQLVIRALLLTTDPDIEAALSKVRAIAHNWNLPMLAAHAENDVEEFDELRTNLANALDELESATRKLTAVEAG
jgi:hypothetical protein